MKNARKYARMFLNTVEDASSALQELAVVGAIKEKSADFASLLESPIFTRKEREQALKAVCDKAGISGATQKFVMFLADKGAASGLSTVLERAVALYHLLYLLVARIELLLNLGKRLFSKLAGLAGICDALAYGLGPSCKEFLYRLAAKPHNNTKDDREVKYLNKKARPDRTSALAPARGKGHCRDGRN